MTTPRPTPRHVAERIVRALRDAGHAAYFAGGCVRDELLGLTPDDYDVATDAAPDRVIRLFPRAGEVGKSFGVVIVRDGGVTVEVATFRADGPYSDRRRPDAVRFSTPEEDARRRDYTVNALFLDPLAPPAPGATAGPRGGTVIDLVGGLPDLAARVLRAVGDPEARLAEDHLRALRAVRLAAKLGFTIEPATAAAIRRHAGDLGGVSRERIGEEVHRMLDHPARAQAAGLLRALGLVRPVVGGSDRDAGPPAGAKRLAGLPASAPYPAALAAWALDLGRPEGGESVDDLARTWRGLLCLSNDHRAGLRATLEAAALLRSGWEGLGVAGQKRAASGAWFDSALAILAAESPGLGQRVASRRSELAATPGGLAPTPWITGDDLAGMGLRPGPRYRKVLDEVYNAQLDGSAKTPGEARELARRLSV